MEGNLENDLQPLLEKVSFAIGNSLFFLHDRALTHISAEARELLPLNLYYHTVCLDSVIEVEIRPIINKLQKSYLSGVDGITTTIVKQLINRLFKAAVFPDVWKVALIIRASKKTLRRLSTLQ